VCSVVSMNCSTGTNSCVAASHSHESNVNEVLPVSINDLKCMVNKIDLGRFSHISASRYLTFVAVSDDVIPTVTTVVVDDEFVVHVAVLTKALPSSHLLWQRIPKTVCSSSDLVSLFSVLSKSV